MLGGTLCTIKMLGGTLCAIKISGGMCCTIQEDPRVMAVCSSWARWPHGGGGGGHVPHGTFPVKLGRAEPLSAVARAKMSSLVFHQGREAGPGETNFDMGLREAPKSSVPGAWV